VWGVQVPKIIDIYGKVFGKLTVVSEATFKIGRSRARFWNCVCECGNTAVVAYGNLVSGNSSSCGCGRKNAGGRPPNCPVGRRLFGADNPRGVTQQEYIAAAVRTHGDKYDYSKVEYKTSKRKIVIGCKACNRDFKQEAQSHARGRGCPSCAQTGFRPERDSYLYVLSCGDLTKLGISNFGPELRAKEVSKSSGKQFEVAIYFIMGGQLCTDTETKLLRELRAQYESPKEKFDGYTETFYFVDREKLISRIQELISDKK
jgi:Zn finger protein HypA/HybF involved in hydrogenase expression